MLPLCPDGLHFFRVVLSSALDKIVQRFFGELLRRRVCVLWFVKCSGPHQRKRSHMESSSLNERQQKLSEEGNPKAALKDRGQERGQEREAQLR